MARDTDRKIISEALRLSTGWDHLWGTQRMFYPGTVLAPKLTLTTDDGRQELQIIYTQKGRIHSLHYYQDGVSASAHPVTKNKRQFVLDRIKGVPQ